MHSTSLLQSLAYSRQAPYAVLICTVSLHSLLLTHFHTNQAWEFSIPSIFPTDMTKPAHLGGLSCLVEMMGIEPMSESISSGISPSAAFVLKFRFIRRPKAGSEISYPVSPLRCRDFPQGFPVCFDTWDRTYR